MRGLETVIKKLPYIALIALIGYPHYVTCGIGADIKGSTTVTIVIPPNNKDVLHYTLTCPPYTYLSSNAVRDNVGIDNIVTHKGGNTHTSCANILTAEYLNPKMLIGIHSLGAGERTGGASFFTRDEFFARETLKDCCQSVKCAKGCFHELKPDCVLWVWNGEDRRALWYGQCDLCQQRDCENTCKNGQYVAEYSSTDPGNKLKDRKAECKSCPSGTFNTCTVESACTWYLKHVHIL